MTYAEIIKRFVQKWCAILSSNKSVALVLTTIALFYDKIENWQYMTIVTAYFGVNFAQKKWVENGNGKDDNG